MFNEIPFPQWFPNFLCFAFSQFLDFSVDYFISERSRCSVDEKILFFLKTLECCLQNFVWFSPSMWDLLIRSQILFTSIYVDCLPGINSFISSFLWWVRCESFCWIESIICHVLIVFFIKVSCMKRVVRFPSCLIVFLSKKC